MILGAQELFGGNRGFLHSAEFRDSHIQETTDGFLAVAA